MYMHKVLLNYNFVIHMKHIKFNLNIIYVAECFFVFFPKLVQFAYLSCVSQAVSEEAGD